MEQTEARAKRILVVDDELPIRELLGEALSEAGYQVDLAATGAEALSCIKANLYDAAIFDFALPDTDGIRLHREVRTMDADLAERTLFVSGVADGDETLGYFASDGGGYFAKPFNVWEVLSAVRKLVAD